MAAMNKESARKQIMFVKNNDYYFIVYNILVILYCLKCSTMSRLFKDWRKLQFLIPIVSDSRYIALLSSQASKMLPKDKQLLSRLYSSGVTTKSQISQVLYLLESNGIISIYKDSKHNTYDVQLIKTSIAEDFFSRDVFFNEMSNISRFIELNKQARTMKYETFLGKLFTDNGIILWHI